MSVQLVKITKNGVTKSVEKAFLPQYRAAGWEIAVEKPETTAASAETAVVTAETAVEPAVEITD